MEIEDSHTQWQDPPTISARHEPGLSEWAINAGASVIEGIANAFFGPNPVSLTPVPWRSEVPPEKALEKMIKNQKKALAEHYEEAGSPFAKLSDINLSPDDLVKKKAFDLTFSHDFADAQGLRPTMEDAHFYLEMEKGILTGVFDGHGGSAVSAYANARFQELFPQALENLSGNVHRAFETVIHQIHEEVANNSGWDHIGTTAVVCYIDTATHQIFTATLGDSEANIYRKDTQGNVVSIPLSCIRDWLSEKDLNRLYEVYGHDVVDARIEKVGGQAKLLRSHLAWGVNIARAIGDVANTGDEKNPLVIHKPKITVNQLQLGDTLVLACDGLKDFVSEEKIVHIFEQQTEQTPVAHQLVTAAQAEMNLKANDNTTVVVIHIS